ncbi:MAG: MGMT family protein [bacterium]
MRALYPGFNSRVYAVVSLVPPGRVTTYGDVAGLLGSRRVARHVGYALAALADPSVPWHRVINAEGRISFRGDPIRSGEQRARLEAEGVAFDARDRVDVKALRWDFPGLELAPLPDPSTD